MSLSSQILSAIIGATKSQPDAFIDSTIYDKSSKVYDVGTATNVYNERSTDVKSLIERFKEDEIDGKIVKNYDVKVTVLPKLKTGFEFRFSSVDRIVVGAANYTVVAAIPQFVGEVVVAYMMHARPQGAI